MVALLEEHLGPLGIEVRSPDYIPDKDTSQLREVDISLRSKIGSSDILVIIECRNRKANEDVVWIEQLSRKRESVGADKAVAVSSSGFTVPASLKATKENIELRTLDEIDPNEIGK
ncbi:MAG: restriction endonuclease [Syntrophorhabdus sp.]